MTAGTAQHWTVGEVAELTRLSIRTLHHYDEIGLLSPSERSEANYRLYIQADLARLYRILTYRDLGFPLAEILRLLNADAAEQQAALQLQAQVLQEQLRRTEEKLRAVTSLLNAELPGAGGGEGVSMSKEQIKQLFDGFDNSQYEDEVKERWGDTAAYRQNQERMRQYSPADLERMKLEGAEVYARYVALMEAGIPAGSPQAAEVAEMHRAHFHRWYYDCTPEMLKNVSHLWVNDPRFTKNIDKVKEGLAAYQYAAVQAWARRQ